MSAATPLHAVVTQKRSAFEEAFEGLYGVLEHSPWNLRVELAANAVGLPAGNAMIDEAAEPRGGSLAQKLGHRSVRAFICAKPDEYGLGLSWKEFHKEVVSYGYLGKYALMPNTPDFVLDMVNRVQKALNRPAETAAEFHQVLFDQLVHEKESEMETRKRVVKKLNQQRNEQMARAKQIDEQNRMLIKRLQQDLEAQVQSNASLDKEVKGLQDECQAARAERERMAEQMQVAKAEVDRLNESLNQALGGKAEDFYLLRSSAARAEADLASARTAVRRLRRQYKVVCARERHLSKLYAKREEALRLATEGIRQVRQEAGKQNLRASRYLNYLKITGSLLAFSVLVVPVMLSIFLG